MMRVGRWFLGIGECLYALAALQAVNQSQAKSGWTIAAKW